MSESSQIAAEWPGRTSSRGPQDKSSAEVGPPSAESILATAKTLRWEIGGDFHMALMESIYTDAARIADRAVTRPDEKPALRPGPHHRWAGHQPVVGLSDHALAVHRGFLVDHHRGEHSVADDLKRADRQGLPGLASVRRHHWDALVVERGVDRRRVPGHRLGDQRDAAADGHLLPLVHLARGFRLPAACGFQPGQHLQEVRRARQTIAEHDDGLRLQRGGRGGDTHHRQPARAVYRHHHQQLRPVQWPLADADSDRFVVHRRAGHGGAGRAGLGAGRGGHRRAGRVAQLRRVVGAFAHGA